VAACVVVKPGLGLSVGGVARVLSRTAGELQVPRHVEFSEADLPTSGAGKVLKRLLRERFWAGGTRAVS